MEPHPSIPDKPPSAVQVRVGLDVSQEVSS